jgi:hypothetical protein
VSWFTVGCTFYRRSPKLMIVAIRIRAKVTIIQFWNGKPRNVTCSVSQSCKQSLEKPSKSYSKGPA